MAIKTKKKLASDSDFDQMRTIVREEVAVQVRQALEEQLVFLPTKDEFFSKMDEVLGEVRGMREEFAAHQSNHDRIHDDTTKLKYQVKHLCKIFDVVEPVDPAY